MAEQRNIYEDWEAILSLSRLLDIDAKEVRRFVEKIRIDPISGCWLWVAALNPDGYGHFTRLGNDGEWHGDPAHRVAHEWYIGPIPDGFQVHHKCDVRSCVKPDHLESLSTADHVAKTTGHAANQTHCHRGHEFTDQNTRWYRGFRACRACANFNAKVRRGRIVEGTQSSLYCVNEHPLFGDNMYLVQMSRGRYRRYCKQCRLDAVDRYAAENQEAVLLAKTLRRADRAAARKIENRQRTFSLRQTGRLIPAKTFILLLRRLLNDCR